jgi:hypothetical protein
MNDNKNTVYQHLQTATACRGKLIAANAYVKTKERSQLWKPRVSWAPVSHAYNPSYLGGKDQEDHGLKPTWTNSS